ncbi:hypothetical protein BGX30_003405 [Mortierella sp. GBA39]|nr:hypothetical protein BGX30_003405 [Mortierella sp. GBA39]
MDALNLAISYKGTLMRYVTSSSLIMSTLESFVITSEMMSRYIGNVVTSTIATGFEVKLDGVNSIEWLSTAVKQLRLTVPLQSPSPFAAHQVLEPRYLVGNYN